MNRRNVLLALLLILSTFVVSGCDSLIPKPEETLYKYEDAINSYDIEAAVECFEPSVQKLYAGGMELGSSIAGIDMNTMIGAAGAFVDLFGDELVEGGMPEMKFTINSQERLEEDKVLMNVTCTYGNLSGVSGDFGEDTMSEDMDVYFVLIDGKWYISADSDMPGMN